MSPTSYQAAPPRLMTIADGRVEVKLVARGKVKSRLHSCSCLGAVGPINNFLFRGLAARTGRETHPSGASANDSRDVDIPRSGERGARHRVRNRHRQLGAIVGDVHLENVATMQIYSAAQRSSGSRW